MKLKTPSKLSKIINTFKKGGFEIYIVGGAVRDAIMGKIIYDWDLTTSATPKEIQKLIPDSFYENEFGTVGIANEEGERPFEITTFRTEEGYSDSRHPDKVRWGKKLKRDLERRDFTINAMALSKKTKNEFELIDPFEGQKDIKKKLVRAVGEASERFSEDALRMIRAVRIASELNFHIEQETFEAIKSSATLVNKIARERVKDELIKILKSTHPYTGMKIFREVGLMAEILPEMEKTFGVEQKSPGRHHVYDVGTHSMLSLKFVAEKNTDPITRFATLIHDIGKPQTFKKLESGTITFYNHEIVSTKIANRIAQRLKFSKNETKKLITLVRWHQFTVSEKQSDKAIRRFIKNVGKEYIEDILDLRVGDRLGSGARETSWRTEEFKERLVEVQKEPFTIHDLKIKGDDVMKTLGIKPGPEVGKILKGLFEKVEEKKLENKKSCLTTEIKKLKK